ncbi:MAG: RNA polymerase factor sigma-54 [Alphaproteobacteria bacterium]
MALSMRQDLRQTQALVMTPQLQQAIRLLQLSHQELAAYVEQELEQNPLLERGDASDNETAVADAGQGDADAPATTTADTSERAAGDTLPAENDSPLDTDWRDVWEDDGPGRAATAPDPGSGDGAFESWGSGGRADFSDGEGEIADTLSTATSLRDHLLGQLALDLTDPADRLIGSHLIDLVDEAGYLRADLDEAAQALGASRARIDAVLARLQRFDPPGVFARSLAECFALQLADRNRLDPAMQALLDNLDMLARHERTSLLRVCGVNAEDLADMIGELKRLDPRPGGSFEHDAVQYVVPDVLMRPQADGGWLIELNPETLPRVLVNTRYWAEVAGRSGTRAEKEFIGERLQAANWLVRALDQRATTILKVAREIVRQQAMFFHKGVQHLRPLVLRDIAEAIGMHESTVSRVTTNKYIATPRGIFELKYFFTSAIAAADGGDAVSAEAVRHRIRLLIDAEKADDVLSDDRIVDILRGDGVDIARRTVAKYRESLRIPSSVQRRRQKAHQLGI